MKQTPSRPRPNAFPYPHFMGFAPLDVWFRLLVIQRTVIPPRFWFRLAFALLLSLFVTIATLPERLLTWLWMRLRKPSKPLPGPVIILGYYRSGTTLLQYLLSRDPNIYALDWAQAFLPQGFCLTWALLRWFILPFLPRTRPQDNMAFGPLVPAEDDFALNNWALASTLPGRIIVPQAHAVFDRFHDLKELTPSERRRWNDYQQALLRKVALQAGQRRVLLKTPAHTARIPALLELYKDTTGVKFLYITRHPHSVFRSNVSMLQQLTATCGLQLPLEREELEDYLLREYVATEEEYQRTRSLIPAGQLVEIRLQDLQADPLGTLRRAYDQLGLTYTADFEQQVIAYLNANRDYKPNAHPAWTAEQKERILPGLEPLVKMGRHEGPPPAKVDLPPTEPGLRRRQIVGGLVLGSVVALLAALLWLLLTAWVGGYSFGVVWPCGVAIGVGVLRGAACRGSLALGLYAVLLTVVLFLAVVLLAPGLLPEAMQWMPFPLAYTWLWGGLALGSAYRIGSQQF
jgi:omega-hydroxy-beta-dihydromenaquinone-9 sulfotransferase